MRAKLRGAVFIENCRFSHRAPDDPIVFPGKPGMSHGHTFVGNRTTNAFSTYGSLRSGSTSCKRREDTSAYWMPTLYQGTTPVVPAAATIYDRRGTFKEVRPFPSNLRMIAGDATATSPQPFRVVFWNCGGGEGGSPSSTVRPARTPEDRLSACTSASPTAGTVGNWTAVTTRATWGTR